MRMSLTSPVTHSVPIGVVCRARSNGIEVPSAIARRNELAVVVFEDRYITSRQRSATTNVREKTELVGASLSEFVGGQRVVSPLSGPSAATRTISKVWFWWNLLTKCTRS